MDKKKLKGKVIDCHNHIGVSIKAYACLEYPYAETVESLYCKQQSAGVDVSIIFPFTPDLHFNLRSLISKGINISDRKPFSEVPFGLENNLIMYELSRFNPEYRENFIPFVSADPMRKIDAQIKYLESLEKKYPIYGIKINPTSSQSRIDSLLKKGEPLLKYARERNIPFLFHTSPSTDDYYSYVGDSLKVIEKNPDVRFILAHAIVFHKGFLDIADSMPNVWVDTAALKIQVDLFNKEKHGEKYNQ